MCISDISSTLPRPKHLCYDNATGRGDTSYQIKLTPGTLLVQQKLTYWGLVAKGFTSHTFIFKNSTIMVDLCLSSVQQPLMFLKTSETF